MPEHPLGSSSQQRGINATELIAPSIAAQTATSSTTEPLPESLARGESAPRRRQRSLSKACKPERDHSNSPLVEVSSPSWPAMGVESSGSSNPPGVHSLSGGVVPHVASVGAKPKQKRDRRKHNRPMNEPDSTVANVITYASLLSQGRLRVSHSTAELQSFIQAHVDRTRDKYCPDAIKQAAEADAAGFEWPATAMIEVPCEGQSRQRLSPTARRGSMLNGSTLCSAPNPSTIPCEILQPTERASKCLPR